MAAHFSGNSKGLTLIEMAIVLGIIGLVAAFFYPSFTRLVTTDKDTQAKRFVQTARDEIVGYVRMNHRFPEKITDIGHHQDPWGNELEFVLADCLENATNICRYCGTDLNATIRGEHSTNVAFLVWSKGKDHQDDVRYGGDLQILDRERTYGSGKIFDDVVEAVSLAELAGALGGHESGDDCSDPDLVACYPMDVNGNDQNLIEDQGPYVLDGTRTGDPTPGLDRFRCPSRAYVFDGSNDYVSVPDNDRLSFTNGTDDVPFSVACWVRVDNLQPGGMISKMQTGVTEWKLQLGADKAFNLAVSDTFNIVGKNTLNAFVLSDDNLGVWYHVVGTYDGSGDAGDIHLFVDGSREDGTTWGSGYSGMSNTASPLELGRRADKNHYLHGALDDVRIYRRALNATEIGAMFNATRATYR
jgi:prepilin-type N-terminal cleavage/methylation domain-containing protein